MRIARALQDAVSGVDWDAVPSLLDEGFFRLMFLAPDVLDGVFAAAPPALDEMHPRFGMTRAIHQSVRTGAVLDRQATARFTLWVRSEDPPALRDVLGVHCARIRELTARGWFADANRRAELVLRLLRAAPVRDEGLHDVAPSVFLLCGTTKMLADDLRGAAACFAEASRWAAIADGHPFGRYADEHLALAHALEERYEEARALLVDDAVSSPAEPGSLRSAYQGAGTLARALLATASFDVDEAQRLLAGPAASLIDADLWWVATHARTRLALVRAEPWHMVHELSARLIEASARNAPTTFPGAIARSDLASLYQCAGDLQAAGQALDAVSAPSCSAAVIARARQALLRGRLREALQLLRDATTATGGGMPARLTPSGAVLYASAELADTGTVSDCTLQQAVTVVQHHQARSALMHASPELRAIMSPLLGADMQAVPSPWRLRSQPPLTRREREVLQTLREHPTVNEVAAALHVSPNTAKTHVQALYRKLGAHSRAEALRLGDDWRTDELS